MKGDAHMTKYLYLNEKTEQVLASIIIKKVPRVFLNIDVHETT